MGKEGSIENFENVVFVFRHRCRRLRRHSRRQYSRYHRHHRDD